MIARILLAAIAAGFVAGIFVSGVQMLRVTPLILAAETYETTAPAPSHTHDHGQAATDGHAHDHGGDTWAPEDGWERTLFTTLSNVLTGAGFALLLAAAMTISGQNLDWRKGILWGGWGYLAFSFLPAFGLPPELPGMAAGDLVGRQIWWVTTAVTSAAGIMILAYANNVLLSTLAIVLLVVPHIIGAPHADTYGGSVPAEMAAQFVTASLVTTGIFWAALGALTGHMVGRQLDAAHSA